MKHNKLVSETTTIKSPTEQHGGVPSYQVVAHEYQMP